MDVIFDVTSGVCWSIVYITAIILGFQNKTWFIPKLAICQNFAWELWMVSHQILNNSTHSVAFAIQITWLVLDIGVLVTMFLYDRGRPTNVLNNTIILGIVMLVMFALTIGAGKWELAAFLINAIMSIAFVIRLHKCPGNWTSIIIALSKFVGTLAATILNGIILYRPLILWLGGICLGFDIYYLILLCKK